MLVPFDELATFDELTSAKVHLRNAQAGRVKDVYFDDISWIARYLVLDLGGWLSGKQVLVKPQVSQWWGDRDSLSIDLTEEQIERCPHPDSDRPVSRQNEALVHNFYGWTPYWATGLPGAQYPYRLYLDGNLSNEVPQEVREVLRKRQETNSPHLRSASEVEGYAVKHGDDRIGRVDDFLVDTETWEMPYAVVDTGNWFMPERRLIPNFVLNAVDWKTRQVECAVDEETVANAIDIPTLRQEPNREQEFLTHFFSRYLALKNDPSRPKFEHTHGGGATHV